MPDIVFALSIALAHAATNLDNMALLFALAPSIGTGRAVGGFAVSQLIALSAAALVGSGADAIAVHWTPWLGVLPIALGVRGLWIQYRGDAGPGSVPDSVHGSARRAPTSAPLTVVLFLALTTDSFAVMTAIFADSTEAFDVAAALGGLISIAALSTVALLFTRVSGKAEALTRRLQVVGPYVMILAGFYVLLDTPTDLS